MGVGRGGVLIAWCTLALSGCANVSAGLTEVTGGVLSTKATLTLETEPAAASCRLLRGQEDLGSFETPAQIELTPSREDILVVCHKPGYRAASAVLHALAEGASASPAGWPSDMTQVPRYGYAPLLRLELTAGP